MTREELIAGLPGADTITRGIADLEAGRVSVEALLVSVAHRKFADAGLFAPTVAPACGEPELELYRRLRADGGDAYARYNALMRELVSFEQTLERRRRTQTGAA